ncbi:MAG: hypothetical protein KJS92_02360 [Bacteroidetes bacterium]|nr:hypothetical protein [Bacteroidota bacterium]
MKKIFLLALSLTSASSFPSISAQETETFYFQGKKVFVFPFRLESFWKNNTGEHQVLESRNLLAIPFCPFQLPDGDYIAFYPLPEFGNVPKRSLQTYSHEDSTHVAVSFSLKNNRKEGTARFYTQNTMKNGLGVVYWEGSYVNDKKEGLWTYYNINSYGLAEKTTRIRFHEDLPDGAVEVLDPMGNLRERGMFQSGKRTGLYEYFSADGFRNQYFTYKDNELHGWAWDTATIIMKKQIFGTSERVWWEQGNKTPRQVKVNGNLKEETLFLDSVTEGYLDSGYWYFNARSWATLDSRIFADGCGLSVDDPESQHYRYVSRKLENGQLRFSGIFLGENRRIETYSKRLTGIPDHSSNQLKQVLVTNRHLYLDTAAGNLFHLLVEDQGQVVMEAYYAIKDFSLTTIYSKTIETRLSPKGAVEFEEDRSADYYRYILKQEVPVVVNLDSTVTRDKHGKVYFEYLKREVYAADTTYILFDRSGSGSNLKSTRPEWKSNISRTADGKLLLTQTSTFHDMPLSFVVQAAISPAAPEQRGLENNVTYDLTDYFLYDQLSDGFPNQVQSKLFLNYRPFNGTWDLRLHKKRFPNGSDKNLSGFHKFSLERIKKPWMFSFDTIIHTKARGSVDWLSAFSRESNRRWNYHGKRVRDYISINTSWQGGQLQGDAIMGLQRLQRSISAAYLGGIKHGTERFEWQYGKKAEVTGFSNHYELGRRTGIYINPFEEKSNEFLNYANGRPDGIQNLKLGNYSSSRLHFMMRQGRPDQHLLVTDNDNGLVRDSLPLREGRVHGTYRSYNHVQEANVDTDNPDNLVMSMMPVTRKVPASEIHFKDGCAIGTARFWFDKGGIKAELNFRAEDSVRLLSIEPDGRGGFDVLRPQEMRLYQRTSSQRYAANRNREEESTILSFEDGAIYLSNAEHLLTLKPYWTADYTYYYLNGQKSQQGRVLGQQKTGWWTYWNEGGQKMKEVDYTPGVVGNPTGAGDSIRFKGRIRGYRPGSGNLLYEGYVLDEEFSYSCATETDLAFEDIFYTSFYDSTGASTMRDYSGAVYDYHITGAKQFTGFMNKGMRDSVWFFFTPGNTLTEAGKYRNGLKHGRWLSGDLEGVNYLDNQCFDAAESWRMDALANELDFTEEVYDQGVQLRREQHNIRLDGRSEDIVRFRNFPKAGKKLSLKKLQRLAEGQFDVMEYSSRARSLHSYSMALPEF